MRAVRTDAAGRTPEPPPTRAGIDDVVATAQIAVARQRIKQALDACRKAAGRLAQAHSIDVYAQRTCTASQDVDATTAVIRLALSEHDQVDVVVLVSTR